MGWFHSIEHNRWPSGHMQALIEEAEGDRRTWFRVLRRRWEARPDSIDRPGRHRSHGLRSRLALSWVCPARAATPIMPSCAHNLFHRPRQREAACGSGDQAPSSDADGHGVPWDEDARNFSTTRCAAGRGRDAIPSVPTSCSTACSRSRRSWGPTTTASCGMSRRRACPRAHPRHPHPHDRGLLRPRPPSLNGSTAPEDDGLRVQDASKNGWRVPEFEKWEATSRRASSSTTDVATAAVTGHLM